jgi:hypothetical protein
MQAWFYWCWVLQEIRLIFPRRWGCPWRACNAAERSFNLLWLFRQGFADAHWILGRGNLGRAGTMGPISPGPGRDCGCPSLVEECAPEHAVVIGLARALCGPDAKNP